jgi:hypothetical protein
VADETLARLRSRAVCFLEQRTAAIQRVHGGTARAEALRAVHQRYPVLLSADAVTEVQRALAGATGEEEQQLRFLLEFLVDHRAAWAAESAGEGRLAWEAGVELPGAARPVPARALADVLAETRDPLERRALAAAWYDALEDLDPVLETALQREREVVEEVGYGGYTDARAVLGGYDVRALARDSGRLLADTDEQYRELLAWYLPRMADGVTPEEASWADVARLHRAEPYDEYFPAGGALATVRVRLGAMGLDLGAGGRLHLEHVAGGPAETRTHVIRVPEHVVLSVGTAPGRRGYARLLRELGRALHRAYTSPDLPFAFRWLGDRSVSLGFGALLRGLMRSPDWLTRVHGLRGERQRDYMRFEVLVELFALRQHAARLLYEIERFDSGAASDRFVELLTDATGMQTHPATHLWVVRPGFAVARTLRAAQLGERLRRYLRERFDEVLFRNQRSGPALAEWLALGRRFTADELSVQLASEPLSFGPVLERLHEE